MNIEKEIEILSEQLAITSDQADRDFINARLDDLYAAKERKTKHGGPRPGSGPKSRTDGRKSRLIRIALSDEEYKAILEATNPEERCAVLLAHISHQGYRPITPMISRDTEKELVRHCLVCGSPYRAARTSEIDSLCPVHNTAYRRTELARWRGEIKRSEKIGTMSPLSYIEWLNTIEHFDKKCAYCQDRGVEVLEHFVSIKNGGETTVANCVPACKSCNAKKDNRNGCFISDDDMERVKIYLESI